MKALVFYGPNDFRVEERPKPDIAEGEALIKVLACGLCGTDVKIFANGHRAITPPKTTGHEIVGSVVESKSDAAGAALGDNVLVVAPVGCMRCAFCLRGEQNICPLVADSVHAFGYYFDGGFEEYMRVPKEAVDQGVLIKIPETSLPLTSFGIAEPLACVINGQEKLRITQDDAVAVLGAGPIGSMHALLAKARGARKIILSDISAEKLSLAKGMPADVFVDSSKEDIVGRVLKETDGKGADIVIVAAPSGQAQADAVKMTAIRGRISLFAGLGKNDSPPQIATNDIHYKEQEVFGAFGANRRQYEEAMRLILEGEIDPARLITHILPLADIKKAVALMKSGEAVKIVIVPQ